MTALIIGLGALLVVGAWLVVRESLRARHAMNAILAELDADRRAAVERLEADRQINQQIDELMMTLWGQHARREGWIPAQPHDQ